MQTNLPWQTFRDGVVYHDYHFNGMQMSIARQQKYDAVMARYESRLIVHQLASYFWADPLINGDHIQSITGADLVNEDLSATPSSSSGTIVWKSIDLIEPVSRVELVWSDDVPEGASIKVEVTLDGGSSWIEAQKGIGVEGELTQAARIRVTMTQSPSGEKPKLYDMALFW